MDRLTTKKGNKTNGWSATNWNHLDNYFFNYVKEKGVKFLNSKVLNIYEDKDEVTIETDDTVIKSNYLIPKIISSHDVIIAKESLTIISKIHIKIKRLIFYVFH